MSRALKHNQLAGPHVRTDRFHGLCYLAKIGLVLLSQGRRYTDYDGIHFGDECEICGRLKSAISGKSYFRLRNTTDVGPRRGKHVDLGAVDIEPRHWEAFFGEQQCQKEGQRSPSRRRRRERFATQTWQPLLLSTERLLVEEQEQLEELIWPVGTHGNLYSHQTC